MDTVLETQRNDFFFAWNQHGLQPQCPIDSNGPPSLGSGSLQGCSQLRASGDQGQPSRLGSFPATLEGFIWMPPWKLISPLHFYSALGRGDPSTFHEEFSLSLLAKDLLEVSWCCCCRNASDFWQQLPEKWTALVPSYLHGRAPCCVLDCHM